LSARKARREAVLKKAVDVFGSEKAAKQWMREPAIGLNQAIPARLVSTAEGAKLVDTYLDQIEYGVYV
jgi:putative toxin-antitoxin system antitoxin component (TIGR02293 family)